MIEPAEDEEATQAEDDEEAREAGPAKATPYTEAELSEALELVASIGSPTRYRDRIKVPIVDVETGIQAFESDLDILDRARVDVPALKLGENRVVIALVELVRNEGALGEWRPSVIRRVISERVDGKFISLLSPKAARESVYGLAADFLATRLAGVRKMKPQTKFSRLKMKLTRRSSDTVITPVCNFRVSSVTPGLMAHWSGAFRWAPNVFGATTANSVLPSGKYLFGVDGPPYTEHQIYKSVVSLPGPTTSIRLPF